MFEGRPGVDYIGITITFFCHDGHGNFVMQKRGAACRDENGRWDIGSGALDWGVAIENTLRKEIKEEYGAKVLEFEFLGHRELFREHNGQATHWLSLSYKVLVDPSQVINAEPHKFDEIAWFRFGSLPPVAELHSQLPDFFARYQHRL